MENKACNCFAGVGPNPAGHALGCPAFDPVYYAIPTAALYSPPVGESTFFFDGVVCLRISQENGVTEFNEEVLRRMAEKHEQARWIISVIDLVRAMHASAPSHSEQVREVGFGLVAEVKYTGYEPANTLNWLKGFDLHALRDGTKLYAEFPGINQITARIEAAEKVHGSLRAAAKALGIDAGYLSRLKSGEKLNPGADVLEALGLERVIFYRPAAE